jgi:hypothetical protein
MHGPSDEPQWEVRMAYKKGCEVRMAYYDRLLRSVMEMLEKYRGHHEGRWIVRGS